MVRILRSRSKGYRAERELVNKLWRLGFAVMRAPASGSKIRKAKYPDVVAIKSGKVLVFEVKSRSKIESIYINGEQVSKLRDFSERAGGQAFIVVKIPNDVWKTVPIDSLEKLPNGSYRLNKELIERSKELYEVLRELKLIPSLEEYIIK